MKNILCTGFKGKLNSSNILLDNIFKSNKIDCLYIENDFNKSVIQLIEKIKSNNIYYNGLEYIIKNKLETQMIFIHIPYLNNIDIRYFSKIMEKYIYDYVNQKTAQQ